LKAEQMAMCMGWELELYCWLRGMGVGHYKASTVLFFTGYFRPLLSVLLGKRRLVRFTCKGKPVAEGLVINREGLSLEDALLIEEHECERRRAPKALMRFAGKRTKEYLGMEEYAVTWEAFEAIGLTKFWPVKLEHYMRWPLEDYLKAEGFAVKEKEVCGREW